MGERQCPASRTGIPGYCYRGGGRAVPGLPRFIPSSCAATSGASSMPSRRGSDTMTSWLRAHASFPLCVLLCSALALCAQDRGAGELRLIRANYRRRAQLPYILYLVRERSLAHHHLPSHPSVPSAGGPYCVLSFNEWIFFLFFFQVSFPF